MESLENPPICIVIRTYFRARTLAEVLDSILSLNYPKELVEVVLSLDPRDVAALEVARGFKAKGVKLEIVTLDVNSADRGRNLGIMKCSSDVVAVVDDDVVLHPETVNIALRYLRSEKVVAVGFPAITKKPSLGEKLHHWRFLGLKAAEASTVMPVTFFKKTELLRIGLYREDMGPPLTIHEDWELGSRIRRHGYKVLITGEISMLHKVEENPRNDDITIPSRRPSTLACVLRSFMSYFEAYVNKYWWTFFEVLKVSPLPQLLEYIAYYLLPLTALALLMINPVWGLLLIVVVLAYIELNSFIRGYYRVLSLKERVAYPLLLTLVRVVRAYLALVGYLYNKIWIKKRSRG